MDHASRMRSLERVCDIDGQCEKSFYFQGTPGDAVL
jgi:hypothetical protein